ncbi:MAG: thermonuclease family protein [Sphingobacteriia bacterium]|nr:thermonuclease family protein [Sphingobacteriia bacterium]
MFHRLPDLPFGYGSGYFFQVGSSFIKLYGIDAPDPSQTCQDKRGNSYNCGEMSKAVLERIVHNKVIQCTPVGYGDKQGNFIATCMIEPDIDIGVVMVGSGWAVADRMQSSVYIPYEREAHQMKRGLWEGQFVAPWDARSQKNSVTRPKQKKKFWGLF